MSLPHVDACCTWSPHTACGPDQSCVTSGGHSGAVGCATDCGPGTKWCAPGRTTNQQADGCLSIASPPTVLFPSNQTAGGDILSQYVDPQDYTTATCTFADGSDCGSTGGALAPGTRTGLSLRSGRLAFLADKGKSGGYDLSKTSTFTFSGVDLSSVQAGNVGTFYLTTLPSGDATGVAPRDLHGSLATYCDAQGSADWLGDVDPNTGSGQGASGFPTQQACPEFDLFEGNMWGFNTTSHSCTMQGQDVTKPVGKACDRSGGPIAVLASGDATRTPFKKTKGTKTCAAGKSIGTEGLYGPDESCPINTLKPFDVTVTVDATTGTFTSTLTQGDEEIMGSKTAPGLIPNLKLPWTMIAAQWAGGTSWLDAGGKAPPTPSGDLDCQDPASTLCYDAVKTQGFDCSKSAYCKHSDGSLCDFGFCKSGPTPGPGPVTCADCWKINQGASGDCSSVPGCNHDLCSFCINPATLSSTTIANTFKVNTASFASA